MGLVKRVFLGRNDSTVAELYQVETADTDASGDFNGFALSDRLAPAGIGGEAAFFGLYIPVIFTLDGTPLRVKVLIDEVEVVNRLFTLVNPDDPDRMRTILEISLLVQLPTSVTGYATRGQWAPRGTWIQVELSTEFVGGAGFLQIDGVELEAEVVVEGKVEGQNP